MKKTLIVVSLLIIILLSAAFAVPVIFKDDIENAIDELLAESVNADITWDTGDFSISLFTNFPNVTAALHHFGVVNKAPFEGTTLFAAEKLEVEVDLLSLFDTQISVNGIRLVRPEISISVLKDGTANYDIAIGSGEPETTAAAVEEPPATFNVRIDHWSISDGNLTYKDATLPFEMEIKHLNHSGSGDFTQDVFDLSTKTSVDTLSVNFDGVEYLSNKSIDADVVISISDNYSRYTFKENNLSVNDFNLGFDGWLALNEDGSMDMDLTYGVKETTFKSLLSLVPGLYKQSFSSLTTAGTLSFNGMAKGTYDSLGMPAFNLALQVSDAMFKYPDLPTAISNISMDLLVDNKDGVIDNTVVDLRQFHMDFGNNPIDARAKLANLSDYDMDAQIKGALNLAELSTMFPMEGMTVSGLFQIDLKANGVYDSVSGKMPAVEAVMKMTDGHVETQELPYALESMAFDAQINSPGSMKDFNAQVKDFAMTMDGEQFKADLDVSNLDNYTWNLTASGGVDLEKITKVFPLEGMELAGKIKTNFTTAGNMADLEAGRYAKLPTGGSVSVAGFRYKDAELPYDVTISAAEASFDPQQVTLKNYNGTVGKSDMRMSGTVTNYMGYVLEEGETLKGQLSFNANLLDLNEFMEEEEESAGGGTETAGAVEEEYGVVEVPKDIDFLLISDIKKVVMMDMTITNATGNMIVKDGILNLNGLKFNMLDGNFAVSGAYDTRNPDNPKYDFKLAVSDLSSQKAFETFSIVQSYFPIAKNINGNLSTDFAISGLLDEGMMPDMKTVSGAGLLNIAKATLTNSKVLKSIGSHAKISSLSDTDEVNIKDILMDLTIEDGQVKVKPFAMELAGYKATISGGSFLDGGLDYNMEVNVPAGKLGAQANKLIAQYAGGANTGSSSVIPLAFGIGGTFLDPKATFKTPVQKKQVADVAKNIAKDKVKEKTGVDLEAEKEKKRQQLLSEARNTANKIEEEGKRAADKVRKEGYDKADLIVKEAGGNFVKKRLAEETAKKLKKETDEKADKIEAAAKKKAQAVMAEAEKKAAAL